MPTFAHGRDTVLFYRGYNLGQYCKEVNWVTEVDTPETTAFGSTSRSYVAGFPNTTATASGMYSAALGATALPEIDNFMDAAMGTTPGWLIYGPIGGTVGTPVGSPAKVGFVHGTNYSVTGSVTDVVGIAADFQVSDQFYGDANFWVSPLDTRSGNGTHNWTLDRTVGEPTTGQTFRIWAQGLNTSDVSVTMTLKHSVDNSTYVDLTTSVAPARTPWNIAWNGTTLNRYIRVTIVVAAATGTPVFSVAAVRQRG